MLRLRNRIVGWMLAVAMVAALLPQFPSVSEAASAYFQFNDYSTADSSPTEVNSNVIDVAGTFTNISSSTITYKVEKLVQDSGGYKVAESSVGSTRPIISGNSFDFAGVSIYEGLNRISVSGANTSGNIVSGEAYVNFTNVPVISEIKLINGTVLPEGSAVVTANPTETITLTAPNATNVTINGTIMFGGAGSTYVLSGVQLNHGLNKLVVVASNANKTYQLTRYLVYYNGSLTAYNVAMGTTSLDGAPTFSAPISGEKVTANVVMPITGTASSSQTFTVQLWNKSTLDQFLIDGSGAPITSDTAATGSLLESTTDSATYSVTSSAGFSVSSNGNYVLRIVGPSGSGSDQLPFSFLSSDSPYISGVKQAYNVTESSKVVSFTSSANFSDSSTLSKLPVWIVLDTVNYDASSSAYTTSVNITQNGKDISDDDSVVVDSTYRTSDKKPVILISGLPAGQLTLTFTVNKSGAPYSVTRNITYYPAPSIQIDNIYSGQVFNDLASFTGTSIVGKLLNFNLTNDAELDTLSVSLNGVTAPLKQVSTTPPTTLNIDRGTGQFSFDLTKTSLTLVAGANSIVFAGTANGIPITTTITVYLFSNDQPAVTDIHPVPYVLPPMNDSPSSIARKFTDPEVKFPATGTNEYTTTEKSLDLLFKAMDFDSLEVQVNGITVAKGAITSASGVDSLNTSDAITTDKMDLYIENPNSMQAVRTYSLGSGETQYQLRLSEAVLPTSGTTTFTIVLHKGTVTASQSITVIRDLSPYLVLAPKLPDEAVINSNFLKVSIKAEGASQVLLGKTAMTKGEGDIFRYELEGLKAGKNTIKFTVVQGTNKINGSFDVTYAADDSIGAQYKTAISKSGKISIFSGDLALSFPKNTFLRQANGTPGTDVKTTDLFNGQNIYFGIADRSDGRTVKKYNQVGETDTSGNYLDGNIKDVAADAYAQGVLLPKANFSYSSNLYWIDAGYFDSTSTSTTGEFSMVDAMLPYQTGNDMFYARVLYPERWLEPSQRGTITIKYDSDIANVYAQNLSVWRFTGNGWTNIGGVVNTGNKTVSAPFDGFGYYAVMGLRYSFSDIIGHPYARTALESMLAHGIMVNKDNNQFGVYENITRGEFAQMMVKIMGVPLEYDIKNMTFDDVQPYDYPDQPYWNYRYVETAVKKGYIRGKSPRLFFPNDPITRAEAAVIIARALNLVKSNADATKDLASLQKIFTDASTLDTYSVSSVLAINKAGFITGIPNTAPAGAKATYRFEPSSNLTRADAAAIAQRIMVKLKKL